MTYDEFINSKVQIAKKTGFEIPDSEICDNLKPHQKVAVKWNIAGGRRANFLNFGLGKTVIQLETLRIILKYKGGKALIVCPFDVMPEFESDAKNILHIKPPVFVQTDKEIAENNNNFFMTNYESVREGKIDVTQFKATSLDEASVLRSFGSKTYQTFLDIFKGIEYKYVNTATPSPNKYKELIHYAGYLEIMDTGQALTRFFKRDSTKANNLTIYPKREKEFWLWMASWALFITKPSDLGFSDEGYDLPPLEVKTHIVKSEYDNPNDRTAGIDTVQRLEIKTDGTSNTLTTIQKDNLVVEPMALDEQNGYIRTDGCVGTVMTDGSSPKHNNRIIEPICINSKDETGKQPSLSDRIYESDAISTAITTSQFFMPNYLLDDFKVRKLTPKECLRLMTFDDADYEKLKAAGISDSAIYKQAGNSIVVNVMVFIFAMMFDKTRLRCL